MGLIKDWLLALSICKKYNIKWNPFKNMKSVGCVYWHGDYISEIKINPFHPKFIDSFMHEVGHLRRWGKIYDGCTVEFRMKTQCILKEEYMAWKYSKRFLKSRFDKERAKRLFKTYYKRASKELTPLVATDRYYAFDRNI